MKTTAIEKATKKVIAALTAKSITGCVGIREVALAVEEMVGEVTLDQVHAAVLKVANFYPSDNPQDNEAERQRSFAWHGGETDPMNWRVWVFKKG